MIEFESVGKTFRDGTAAVVDLNLRVPSGQITAIVGPSGCGKTTTLRMVNRMIEPTQGRITWDGKALRSQRKTTLRRQMGYVIQSGGLFPHRTVVDNIGTVPALLGWSKSKISKRSLELLENVGLDRKLADRYPAQLSGGQQQRVGVARALAADPLVLLDEPFSSLDATLREETRLAVAAALRASGATAVLVTHDQAEAMTMGDRVAVLDAGRLQQVGPPQEIYDAPANRFVAGFIGSPPMNFADGGGIFGGDADTVVGVRPEDLHIDPAGDVAMTVTVVESLGSETVLAGVDANGARLTVRTAPRAPHTAGEQLRLRVDPARRHVFARDTGVRVER